ncbi:MAG: hypothetical protein ACYCOU_07425 [Sulfobacillus sp.]
MQRRRRHARYTPVVVNLTDLISSLPFANTVNGRVSMDWRRAKEYFIVGLVSGTMTAVGSLGYRAVSYATQAQATEKVMVSQMRDIKSYEAQSIQNLQDQLRRSQARQAQRMNKIWSAVNTIQHQLYNERR